MTLVRNNFFTYLTQYNNTTHCQICDEELGSDCVTDHCPLSGKFNSCNFSYKVEKFISVILHSLTRYDCRSFIKKLRGFEHNENEKIKCTSNTGEKDISLNFKRLVVDKFLKDGQEIIIKRVIRFIDSFRFLA
jgi:hypothetical protein